MRTGRPSKYKPEFCEMMIDYFNREDYIVREKQVATASGRKVTMDSVEASDYPSFYGFAAFIRVNIDTLHEWKKVHPDFSDAYAECKAIQARLILTHAMNGNYNASFAKFMLINNFGMKDKIESDINQTSEIKISSEDADL